MSPKEFKLGEVLKDEITGFQGTVIAVTEFLNGCVQYALKPKVDKEGKVREAEYFDSQQLVRVGTPDVKIKKTNTGGIMADLPKGL